MSARRSGRSKAPVKYTSDSDPGSDFGSKKKQRATPKKRTKTEAEPASTTDAPKKRTKKDPATLAAEHKEKAAEQEFKAEKATNRKSWDSWLASHDAGGALLDEEPGKDVSITQTDAGKKYGLKKEDLGALKCFEKRNPVHNNTMKLYVESEVRELGFRKLGVLEGGEGDEAVEKGEEIWREEHKDDEEEAKEKKPAKSSSSSASKAAPKKKWAEYIDHATTSHGDNFSDEPEKAINQTDSSKKYKLQPKELAALAYFGKPNPKYGNTTKLFKQSDVEALAWRKAAVLGGVEEDEGKLLEKGREMWEEEHGAVDGEEA